VLITHHSTLFFTELIISVAGPFSRGKFSGNQFIVIISALTPRHYSHGELGHENLTQSRKGREVAQRSSGQL
jgi:hypothetical protein